MIESLFRTFRERYDATAVATTPAFPGYTETLAAVRALGFETIIVTNKRIVPTRLILERHGGSGEFTGVYALDAFDPPLPNKAAVVARVIELHGISTTRSVLVGDSVEDASAADANGVPFIAATYGYGNPDSGKHPVAARIGVLAELPARLVDLAL
jgi:phosphoglycolate phosphatase